MASIRSAAGELFRGVIGLSALATGGNLPYRRLCREFGADLTCSEMIVAEKLVRGSRSERPLLRFHPSEQTFGVQLCGKDPAVMAEAARLAVASGCRFVDLNFACPIDLIVRRGAGAGLLKRPALLARIVAAVRAAIELPLSVKIRAGWSARKINALEVARRCEEAGADAIGLHGRTREQHYRRQADWELIGRVAEAVAIPVLGNGDILTHWDLAQRLANPALGSVLIGRGAVIKPWIFRELKQEREIEYGPADRWAVMRRYYEFASEHFGADEKGQKRVARFFRWHLGFWFRYRFYREADWRAAQPAPLLQQRDEPVTGDPEAVLLASRDPADHERIWQRIQANDFPGAVA